MPEPAPAPSAWSGVKRSRKVLMWVIATIPILLALLLADLAIFVRMVQGKIALEAGVGLMFGAVALGAITALPLAKSVIDGWTREDEAKTAAAAPRPTDGAGAIAIVQQGQQGQQGSHDEKGP